MIEENSKQSKKYEVEVTNNELKERILVADTLEDIVDTVSSLLCISSKIKFLNYKIVSGTYVKENYSKQEYNELIEEYVATEDIQNYIMNRNNLTDDDFFLITKASDTGEEYLNYYYTANEVPFLKVDLSNLLGTEEQN